MTQTSDPVRQDSVHFTIFFIFCQDFFLYIFKILEKRLAFFIKIK